MGSRRRAGHAGSSRALVVAGLAVVLALDATVTTLFLRSGDEVRREVEYLSASIEVPIDLLNETIEANAVGEVLLVRAAAATGDRRDGLLREAVAAGQAAAEAWRTYRERALDLPREAELAAAYERDDAAVQAIGTQAVVSIIESGSSSVLPDEQFVATEKARQDLLELRRIYESARDASLQVLDDDQVSERGVVLIAATAAGALALVGFGIALRAANRAAVHRRGWAQVADLADFEGRLVRAYEFTTTEDDAFRVAARAFSEELPDATVSVVVADASLAAFSPLIGVPSCGVARVEDCPATRAGGPLQFRDSGSIDTCPVFASGAGAGAPCAVTCVPVSVAGMAAAVVQLTGPVGEPPDPDAVTTLTVRRLGDRITAMRALARFQLQAMRDPLTGLLNRRSLEEAVVRLVASGTPYAVAFADLDHFKHLNDVYGHDAGDRALRAFAATLKTSLRPDDLVGRWGGEEFVIVLPACDEEMATDAVERVRANLVMEALDGSNAATTVSIGVAVAEPAEPFDQVLARADAALHEAKTAGRDRVNAWKPRQTA